MGRRRFGKKKGGIHKAILVLMGAMMFYSLFLWHFTLAPNIEEISAIKTKGIIMQTVNNVIRGKFADYISVEELLLIRTNTAGEIEMVQANTPAINSLLGQLSRELRAQYREIEPIQMSVPIGSIFGSKIFSQTGPSVKMKIKPVSIATMDFRTEFETQGINQTKYKVYVIFNTEAMVLSPFSSNTVTVSNTILVAETVILGRVPQSFVNVPAQDILDGMDSAVVD